MEQILSEVKELRLKDTVVVRKLPMDQRGSDNLRAIREHLITEIKARNGEDVRLSMPATIHLVLADYRKLKGI